MSTAQQELNITNDRRTVAPVPHNSTIVRVIDELANEAPNETLVSVEIFSRGNDWYCQVCRGDKKTQPMGPYTKQQAERIREERRMLIAKKGTARLVFQESRDP